MNASLVVAICGLVLACLSLGWQAATYVLTGGRVKVGLRIGAMSGRAMVTAEPDTIKPDWLAELAQQGYRQPIAAIKVANVGRQPVTVERCGFRHPAAGTLFPVGDLIGKPLPHRLEVGQSETWAMDLGPVVDLLKVGGEIEASRPARGGARVCPAPAGPAGIVAVAELADGKMKRSRESFR